jgi:hypothetical protein
MHYRALIVVIDNVSDIVIREWLCFKDNAYRTTVCNMRYVRTGNSMQVQDTYTL